MGSSQKRKMIRALTLEASLIITDSPSTDTTLPLYNRSKIENWQGKQHLGVQVNILNKKETHHNV